MATLSQTDIEKLFSGAPQFFARSEGHYTGAPHPSVAFPYDEKVEIRDTTDHVQIEDYAWGCATAWPHIVRDVMNRDKTDEARDERRRDTERRSAHFYPRCRERPNMLSMQGLEKGTMGYQAAMELTVADALQDTQFGFEHLGTRARAVVDARQRLLVSKDGLRHLDEEKILHQLIKNGERYRGNKMRKSLSNELYNDLFLNVMHPPGRVLDHRDPYSLSVQIQQLLKVLAADNVWIDFSQVEWRIRLGQILWATAARHDGQDDIDMEPEGTDADEHAETVEERYWLLLQVLLSCELLIRLDAITEGDELGIESIQPSEVRRFEKEANTSVKWSLILARSWLENIDVVRDVSHQQTHLEPPNHSAIGWLTSLAGKMSLHAGAGAGAGTGDAAARRNKRISHPLVPGFTIKGRHDQRQVDGLTHFARKLRWPDIDTYASRIGENCRTTGGGTPIHSPVASPRTIDTKRSSYFGSAAGSTNRRASSVISRRRRRMAAALHPSGWLSKSYVSGLMLPGEGLYHFLMSTLLENDGEAMAKLGPMANLCGGFVYGGKSFWSTSCVVGRVLAAGRGAAECMGWISSDVTPTGLGDGWLNIEVEDLEGKSVSVEST